MGGNLSKSLGHLCLIEENTVLAATIRELGNLQDEIKKCTKNQVTADIYDLSELIKDYIGMVGAVKEVFNERLKAWQNWQTLTMNLTKKRESKAKAELQMKIEKANILTQEIMEYERQQEIAQSNFEKISRMIKKEMEFFDNQKVQNFKKITIIYLEKMLEVQNNIAFYWDNYLQGVQQVKI